MVTDLTDIGRRLARLRAGRPVVHCLTNLVTMRDVADATLAIGALPIMAVAGEEVEEITAGAQALVLNLGTPTRERLEVMRRAGRVAGGRGVPVVLDPVGAGASAFRTEAAWQLLADVRVTVVRANAGETAALLGARGTVRGVEAAAPSTGADALARDLAARAGTVVAVTGARDHVSDVRRLVAVDNGNPLLARITGGGDLATALVAAFAAVEADALVAAVCGLVALGVAAETAAPQARGPGSFRVGLIDALAGLAPDEVNRRARVTVLHDA